MDDAHGTPGEPPRREVEAAASPFLVAPDAEPEPAPAPRRSGLPVGLGAAAAGAIVIALVLWGLSPRSTNVERAGVEGDVLDPIQPRADVRTGEQVAPFSGFAVSVDTDPPGAVVSIAGVRRGEAPVLAGVDCAAGDRVEIAAQKRGYPVARTATTCRTDALVKLTVRLRR
ncbi:MAG TPA: hypothetical protein VFL83_12980 [Anaeromyxobacter sp.]|nr:hypothetical protein [Anaeromyxobacter sp.]